MTPARPRVHRGSSDEVLWKLQPATEAKHRLYKRYLDGWWPIMLQQSWVHRLTYVDAFAGPGEYEDGEDGSPTFVLDRLLHHESLERMGLRRDRVTLIFIEGDKARYEHLCSLLTSRFGPLDELPVTVVIRHGKAELDTLSLLTETGAWGSPILSIFDSWGNVAVPLTQLAEIAKNRSSEVIVTFGANWFSRRESEEPAKLDSVFGGAEFWQASDPSARPQERWQTWLETYRQSLIRAGFSFSLPFQVVPRTGQPLDLIFGTGHPRGVEVFKDAMWKVDQTDGMRFSDPHTTAAKQAAMTAMHPTLFDDPDAPDSELLAFVADCLSTGSKSLDQVRDFLMHETARWLAKHAVPAVEYLVKDGRVKREPATGRLTADTKLWLAV